MSRGLLPLKRRQDERGALVAIESGREVPFDIARVYYVYGVSAGVARGFHAHRALAQVAVAVAGAVTIAMDDGRVRWEQRLDRPDVGLLIPPMVWHEMHAFTTDCVLMVLASAHYDESDYVRDRAEFERLIA